MIVEITFFPLFLSKKVVRRRQRAVFYKPHMMRKTLVGMDFRVIAPVLLNATRVTIVHDQQTHHHYPMSATCESLKEGPSSNR